MILTFFNLLVELCISRTNLVELSFSRIVLVEFYYSNCFCQIEF